MVDVAVAAAVADYWLHLRQLAAEGKITVVHPGDVIQHLAKLALDRLVAAGCERKPATRAVRRRLSRYEFQPREGRPAAHS